MLKINGSKEFMGIISSYKYETELKQRLLKQGKTFEQGLRDMLNQRNLDIKKHEMEEDEAEKFQSHLGGINATSNRLKIAMKSMEDDMKREDRRNVISVLIKNKDDDLDKEKVNDITDFASEDVESALNKKLQNKALQRKKSMSRNPLVPNTFFNMTRRSSKSGLSDLEKEYEFRQSKASMQSVKKVNNYLDMNNVSKTNNFQFSGSMSQTQKMPSNNFGSTNASKFPNINNGGKK